MSNVVPIDPCVVTIGAIELVEFNKLYLSNPVIDSLTFLEESFKSCKLVTLLVIVDFKLRFVDATIAVVDPINERQKNEGIKTFFYKNKNLIYLLFSY